MRVVGNGGVEVEEGRARRRAARFEVDGGVVGEQVKGLGLGGLSSERTASAVVRLRAFWSAMATDAEVLEGLGQGRRSQHRGHGSSRARAGSMSMSMSMSEAEAEAGSFYLDDGGAGL